MTTSGQSGLDPALFGDPPERDDRFDVKEQWHECVNLPDNHPERTLEFLHRQMNEEVNVLENAARSLYEFPDADWSIRKGLARQAADEARHTEAYKLALVRRGGTVGQYPVMNFQYRILGRIDSLIGRFGVQNRTFEADGLDAVTFAFEQAQESGETDLLGMYDAQQADEVVHVRYANEWIAKQIKVNPLSVLDLARALTHARTALDEVTDQGGRAIKHPVAETERLEAGFSRAEVDEAARGSDARRAAYPAPRS